MQLRSVPIESYPRIKNPKGKAHDRPEGYNMICNRGKGWWLYNGNHYLGSYKSRQACELVMQKHRAKQARDKLELQRIERMEQGL